jgi:cysteine synthase A
MEHVVPATESVLRAVGRTPLVRLEKLERPGGPRLFVKCEFLGPGNSIFDRAAVAIFEAADHGGHLTPGRTLVAAGGSDASISLAMVASASGHPLTVVVPKSLHPDRRRALADYGARLSPLEDDVGFLGARHAGIELSAKLHGLFLDLFDGAEIIRAYEPIGREVREALGHVPALLCAGLDLGAIPTGIARGLRTGRVVAVEPENARVGSGGTFDHHFLSGLAPAAEPTALDRSVISEFEAVSDREAWDMAERLSRETGVLAGIASGAVLVAALRRAANMTAEQDLVAVLPDSGERRFALAPHFA